MHPLIFSAGDINYLVKTFSLPELRKELYRAELQSSVSSYLGDDDVYYWQDYVNACLMAIEIKESFKPVTTTIYPSFIDADSIKAKNDIVNIVSGYTKLRKSGRYFTGRCPIHQDRNPSLTVYPEQQSWHCYGCQRGGDVISFIQEVEHTDFKGAITILRNL